MKQTKQTNKLKVIIPASGTGERFKALGYKDTKPLIDVLPDKKIIDYVVDIFKTERANIEFFFIMSAETYTAMTEYVSKMDIDSTCILYQGDKLGPVGAITGTRNILKEHISPEDQVIVSYCDYGMEWDFDEFLDFIESENPDGAIPCYTGYHPHLEPIQNVYAACKTLDNGEIFEVKEKYESLNKEKELWSPGLYYFKSFDLMNIAFDRTIEANDLINSEYYVSVSYNHMPEFRNLVYLGIKKFFQFGTPSDFEYVKNKLQMLRDLDNLDSEIDNIVILSAGKGERFLNLGFNQPKPFLPLKDSDLITVITDSFNSVSANIEYIASNDHKLHWENFNSKGNRINYIKANKIGAAYSYLEGASHINGEVLIVPCDLVAKHITEEFLELKKTSDVIVFTADATPFSLQNPNSFAWVEGKENIISNISIKERMNIEDQMVLIGSFWVKDNEFLLENIIEIFELYAKVNGEYYLDSAFKNMLGKTKVNYIKLDKYFSLGTPSEYNESKYFLD